MDGEAPIERMEDAATIEDLEEWIAARADDERVVSLVATDRTDERGDENLSFERAVLLAFEPDRRFEVVSSCYTLCYVSEIERAVRALYDAVEPGGYLLFTDHDGYTQSLFAEMAERPHEYLDEDSAWDPDHFPERFAGVIGGESSLSYRTIQDLLGAWPQSLLSLVEAERYRAWRQNPVVVVPKPG